MYTLVQWVTFPKPWSIVYCLTRMSTRCLLCHYLFSAFRCMWPSFLYSTLPFEKGIELLGKQSAFNHLAIERWWVWWWRGFGLLNAALFIFPPGSFRSLTTSLAPSWGVSLRYRYPVFRYPVFLYPVFRYTVFRYPVFQPPVLFPLDLENVFL